MVETSSSLAPDLLPAMDDTPTMTVAEKWQGAVNAGSGFVAVPMSLLRLQSKYDLSATDMLVLINLLAHWWDPARSVFPRTTTLARRMGIDKRTVQRSTSKLKEGGLLTKTTLADGKRGYGFEVLAKRLARDLWIAQSIRGHETHGS